MKSFSLIFIGAMINRESWRFSYSRKCYNEKLKTQKILLPVDKNDKIDEEYIEKIVTNCPYWKFIEKNIHS